MSLRWKTVILVICTAALVVIALFATSQFIFMRGFQKVENQNTEDAVERVREIILDRVQSLNTLNHDWAAWDDTYNFVRNPEQNQNYIESNPTDTTFANAGLNLLIIADLSGNLVFGKAFDLDKNAEAPLPGYLDDYVMTPFLLNHNAIDDSKSGILVVPNGQLLISYQPIINSQGQGPIAGTLIMAQFLDSKVIDDLSNTAHLPLEIVSVNKENISDEFKIVLPSLSVNSRVLTSTVDSKTIAGYGLLDDITGQPTLVMKTSLNRDIYASGATTMRFFYASLLLTAVVLGILLYFLIGRLVISRISEIGSFVNNISASGDLSKRLPNGGSDELSHLGNNINHMVDALQTSQEDLKTKQLEAQKSNADLVVAVGRLEQKDYQSRLLSEMRDLLQACATIKETPPIIMSSMKKLFPAAGGALFLLSPSRSDLEAVAKWGDYPEDSNVNVFTPEDCWGLRRGSIYVVDDINLGPVCPHVKQGPSLAYACLPLVAKSDVVGLLHIRINESSQQNLHNTLFDFKAMASTISEYMSLSIANIKLSETLANQSIRDPLTGLFNKRYMEEFLQREILRAVRKHTNIGVIMADIDHFKDFNDKHGHLAGDRLLEQLGQLLVNHIRGSDIACRYGGEEFVIFLPETSRADAFKRADSLRSEIGNLEIYHQRQTLSGVTVSMGVSIYPEDGTEVEELLRKADSALYRAKHEGRNQVYMQVA